MKSNDIKAKTATSKNADVRPKFRIGFEAPQIGHRQLLLTIDENTTNGVDWGYDGEMNGVLKDDLFWDLKDTLKYVIQALPDANIDREIPLGIVMGETGLASIKIDTLENVDSSIELFIKDNLTGETYQINDQPFEINLEIGEYLDRFALVFQPRLKTIAEITLEDGVFIYMNNDISELQVDKIVDTKITKITLFNYLGQQIKTWSTNLTERNLSLPINVATGFYIININTTNGSISKKIIIE
jgi:hypothetical protein